MAGVILYVRTFSTVSGLPICWLFDKPPIRHLGFTGGPARPVIVRSVGALIDVAEYAEMKVGVLVKNRAFRIHVGAEVPGNKICDVR
jgi:hypothetical protein